MIQPPRSPQLMQLVATAPHALWAVERVNLGYAGPTVEVRRADAVLKACHSQADIAAFCGTQNGFVHNLYDQSRNGYHAQQNNPPPSMPKLYDGATQRLMRFGRTPVMVFDGTATRMGALLGLPTGSPAITTAFLSGPWGWYGWAWSIGESGSNSLWMFGNDAAPDRVVITYGDPIRYFLTLGDLVVTPGALVILKAAGAAMSAVRARQNKTELTSSSTTEGAQVLGGVGAFIGCHPAQTVFGPSTTALLGHWNALLAGQDLDGLEQVLERMRVQ